MKKVANLIFLAICLAEIATAIQSKGSSHAREKYNSKYNTDDLSNDKGEHEKNDYPTGSSRVQEKFKYEYNTNDLNSYDEEDDEEDDENDYLLDYSTEVAGVCAQDRMCDKCPTGEYKILKVQRGEELQNMKVCCPNCGKYFRAGYNKLGSPGCACDRIENIFGDCWKGSQCDGAINMFFIHSIPVCCPAWDRSPYFVTSNICTCLFTVTVP